MKTLGSISENAGQVPTIARLAELADRAQPILAGLDLSTPAIDDALVLLRDNGALGGKLSGAGGGGAFLGIFRDEQTARAAAAKLTEWLEVRHPLPTGPFSLAMSLQ